MRTRSLAAAAAFMLVGASPATQWRPAGALVGTGRIAASGLDGTWRRVTDLGDGRFYASTDLAAMRSAEIYDGQTYWREPQHAAKGGSISLFHG